MFRVLASPHINHSPSLSQPKLLSSLVRLVPVHLAMQTFKRAASSLAMHEVRNIFSDHRNQRDLSSLTSTQPVFASLASSYSGINGAKKTYGDVNANNIKPASQLGEAFSDSLSKFQEIRSVIDVGAAEGSGTVYFANRFPEAKITAVDIDARSAQHIEQVRKNNPEFITDAERLTTATGTLSDLSLAPRTVSVIHMSAVAPYIDDKTLVSTVKTAYDALHDGGVLLISFYGEEHNPGYGDHLIRRSLHDESDMPGLGIFSLLEDAGISSSEVQVESTKNQDWHQHLIAVTKGSAQGGG